MVLFQSFGCEPEANGRGSGSDAQLTEIARHHRRIIRRAVFVGPVPDKTPGAAFAVAMAVTADVGFGSNYRFKPDIAPNPRSARERALTGVGSSCPHGIEKFADLALQSVAFTRERLRRRQHLAGRRTSLARPVTDLGDFSGNLGGELRRLLHVPRNLLRRRALLLDGRGDGGGDRADFLDGTRTEFRAERTRPDEVVGPR